MEVVEYQDGAIGAFDCSSRMKTSIDGVARRAAQLLSPSIAAVSGRKRVPRAGGDQVVRDRDPVSVVLVEPVPQGPQPGPARESAKSVVLP